MDSDCKTPLLLVSSTKTLIVKTFLVWNSHTLMSAIVAQLNVLTNDCAAVPGVPYSCVGFTGYIITCSSHVNVCVCVCVEFLADYDGNPPSVSLLNLGLHLCAPYLSSPQVSDATSQAVAATYDEELKAETIGRSEAVYRQCTKCIRRIDGLFKT